MVLFAHSVKIRAGRLETLLNPIARGRYAQLQELSQSALFVLDGFKSSPKKCLIVSDIEKDTGMPRRTIRYALKILTQKAFIQKLGQKSRNPLSADFLIIQSRIKT